MQQLLLVEDDPATTRAMRTILSRRGWSVLVAATVAEALRLLDRTPQWVVLDLMLPDGDGTTVLREIRTHGLNTRVAVTTGTSDTDRIEAVTELRPEVFLRKPIDLSELFRNLDGVG